MCIAALGTFLPGIDLGELLRDLESFGQDLTPLRIFNNLVFDELQTDAFNPRRGAFQLMGVFAIQLQESIAPTGRSCGGGLRAACGNHATMAP